MSEFAVVEEERNKREVDPLDPRRFGTRSGVNRVGRRALETNQGRRKVTKEKLYMKGDNGDLTIRLRNWPPIYILLF